MNKESVAEFLDLLVLLFIISGLFEPVCEKTNNLCSDQVRHQPGSTVIEDG